MGIMTNRSSIRTGKLAFLLLTLTVLAGCQPGLAKAQDFERLRKAAEQGDATAQVALGLMCAKGEGVPEDGRKAVKWFRLAAEQRHAEAVMEASRAC